MSNILNHSIDGDLEVGRNAYVGGNAEISGRAHVHGGLKVDGWLEASNIKAANKGIFSDELKLRNAYPTPHEGWFAGVEATADDLKVLGLTSQNDKMYFRLYIGEGGEWTKRNTIYEITVDVDDINTKLEDSEALLSAFQTELSSVKSDVSSLSSELSSAKNTVATHTLQLSSLGNTVDDLTSTVSVHTRNISGLQVFVEKHGESISGLERTVQQHETELSDLSGVGLTLKGFMTEVKALKYRGVLYFDGFARESEDVDTEAQENDIIFLEGHGVFVAGYDPTNPANADVSYYNTKTATGDYRPNASKLYICPEGVYFPSGNTLKRIALGSEVETLASTVKSLRHDVDNNGDYIYDLREYDKIQDERLTALESGEKRILPFDAMVDTVAQLEGRTNNAIVYVKEIDAFNFEGRPGESLEPGLGDYNNSDGTAREGVIFVFGDTFYHKFGGEPGLQEFVDEYELDALRTQVSALQAELASVKNTSRVNFQDCMDYINNLQSQIDALRGVATASMLTLAEFEDSEDEQTAL